MKNQIRQLSVISLTAISLFLILNSCAKKVNFIDSARVPAVRGTVGIKTDKNKNYAIHIEIANLAEVSRLNPAKQTYIVWMVTDQNITKNIGQLISAEKGISQKLEAHFKTVSAFRPTKIFITTEDEAST